MSKKLSYKKCIWLLLILAALNITGCEKKEEGMTVKVDKVASAQNRNAEPKCFTPTKGGEMILGDDELTVDITNAKDGYLYVSYLGNNEDIKMQISTEGSITYTYKLHPQDTVIPLSLGLGEYSIIAYEGMGNGMYATKFAEKFNIDEMDEFGPYLYPNYYIDFNTDSKAVELGKQLATGKTCDLEVIAAVYEYVVDNIVYDYDRAKSVEGDYIPNVDEILSEKKGICFDYSALMTAMLRSQRIPTRLEVGYAGDAYHAWISCYIEDQGWINGLIEFDGNRWTLMDPTFAANSTGKTLEKFIGDGNNYSTKYIY